ncbi:hypothetical protein [Hymenobacter busanensis]|nr:hypothetical protein [Hymenobacter busanensis]QHJ09198.1 hypothetical protein GUY19_18655 [Hymenobacter busanensis]
MCTLNGLSIDEIWPNTPGAAGAFVGGTIVGLWLLLWLGPLVMWQASREP